MYQLPWLPNIAFTIFMEFYIPLRGSLETTLIANILAIKKKKHNLKHTLVREREVLLKANDKFL